ncbi:hypothetical protein [Modestobacter sp. SSW1-42]
MVTLTKGLIAEGDNLTLGLVTGTPPSIADTLLALGIGAVGYGLSITRG